MSAGKHNHILTAVLIFAGVFIVWEMYKAWQAGTAALSSIFMAPWNALKSAWSGASSAVSSAASTVANNYNWASQLPALAAGEVQGAQNQESVAASYQPGGSVYNMILATQGQAAADAAANTAAQNAANQTAQANADASSWETQLFGWL